jgi:hypothetical protein
LLGSARNVRDENVATVAATIVGRKNFPPDFLPDNNAAATRNVMMITEADNERSFQSELFVNVEVHCNNIQVYDNKRVVLDVLVIILRQHRLFFLLSFIQKNLINDVV